MWLVAVVGRCLVGCQHYEGLCSVEHVSGIIYAHLQENKGPVTVLGVYWSGFVGCGW
jgi:hypothetical protein